MVLTVAEMAVGVAFFVNFKVCLAVYLCYCYSTSRCSYFLDVGRMEIGKKKINGPIWAGNKTYNSPQI